MATAAAMPVAYLSAHLALQQAGFSPGKSVLAPGAGGSVGNATYQLARAMGAARVITTAGSAEKAAAARAAGMTDVIDLSVDELAATARKLTDGSGVDVVIDALGGDITSSSLAALGFGGRAIVIGYAADRKSLIRLTDLIWTSSSVRGFSLFTFPPEAIAEAYEAIFSLLERGEIAPAIDRVEPLEDAATALQHLIEDRPFGKVVLSINGGPSS